MAKKMKLAMCKVTPVKNHRLECTVIERKGRFDYVLLFLSSFLES